MSDRSQKNKQGNGQPTTPGFKIAYKIFLLTATLFLLVFSSLWLMVKNELTSTLQAQTDSLGTTLLTRTADSITELVLANDILSLNVVLKQLATNQDILNVTVFNVDNQVIASSGSNFNQEASLINASYTAPIALQDSIAGSIRLTLSLESQEQSLGDLQLYFWGISALGLVLALAASFSLGQHLGEPLVALAKAVSADNGFSHHEAEDDARSDEVGILLRACKEAFSSQQEPVTTKTTANKTQAADCGKFTLLSVKPCDLEALSELYSPQDLDKRLNESMTYLKAACDLYGGDLHLQHGQALLSFDARQAPHDHSFNAICCAQLFLCVMSELKTRGDGQGENPAFALGIHSGNVFQSSRSNSQERAILGKTVELTQHLSGLGTAGRVLLSRTAYSEAGGEGRLGQPVKAGLQIPDQGEEFEIYVLDGVGGPYLTLLQRQTLHLLESEASRAEADIS